MLQDESKLLGSQVNCETPLFQNNLHVAVNSRTTEDIFNKPSNSNFKIQIHI